MHYLNLMKIEGRITEILNALYSEISGQFWSTVDQWCVADDKICECLRVTLQFAFFFSLFVGPKSKAKPQKNNMNKLYGNYTNNKMNKMRTLPTNIRMHMNIICFSEGFCQTRQGPPWLRSSGEWAAWIPRQEKNE